MSIRAIPKLLLDLDRSAPGRSAGICPPRALEPTGICWTPTSPPSEDGVSTQTLGSDGSRDRCPTLGLTSVADGRKAGTMQECRMVSGRQDRADLQGELRAGTARGRVGLCHSLSLAGPRRRTLPEVPRAAVGFAAESPLPRDPVPSDPPWEPGEPDGIHCSPSKARRPMEHPKAGGHLGWRWGAGESREEVGCWSHLHLRLI